MLPLLIALTACTPGVVKTPVTPADSVAPTDTGPDSAPIVDSTPPADSTAPDSAPPVDSAPLESIGQAGLQFDPEHGLVDDPFELRITWGVTDATLRYTLDGSDPRDPDNAAALAYDAPLSISSTTVVRAVAWLDGAPASDLETRTWIFPASVQDQAPGADWPTAWFTASGRGDYTTADYAMDPDVVDADPDAVELSLRAVPTMSLVIDLDDLFGETGIYDNPTAEGDEWERPVAIELLPTDDEEGFAIEAGARIHGNASRDPESTPKKSFRLVFKESYGDGELAYPLYDETDVDHFDTLLLRAGYNLTWTHWDPTQRERSLYVRDSFASDSQRALGDDSVHDRAVHLYINGLYWGLYRLTERPDARAMASWYGGETADWDVINTNEAVDGTDEAWTEAMALAEARDAAGLEAVVDTANFIDYMLLNFYLANDDWPANNWYATRMRPDGLWRFFSWDAEHILEELSTDMTGANALDSPAQLWIALLSDPTFKEAVSARAAELLAEDGALGVTASSERFASRITEIEGAVLAESARWGDYRDEVFCYSSPPCPSYTVDEHWAVERARIEDEYLPQRTDIFAAQLTARGL